MKKMASVSFGLVSFACLVIFIHVYACAREDVTASKEVGGQRAGVGSLWVLGLELTSSGSAASASIPRAVPLSTNYFEAVTLAHKYHSKGGVSV